MSVVDDNRDGYLVDCFWLGKFEIYLFCFFSSSLGVGRGGGGEEGERGGFCWKN